MSGDREEPGHGPEVGSVADEAAKLLGALSDWAKDAAQDAGHSVDQHLATGAPECTYCPVCRTVHAVRELSPEVRAQVATAATSLLQAAAGVLARVASDQPGRPGGVEHIDLDADPGDDGDWPVDTGADDSPEEGDR
jgi:hypothetical protein